MLSKPLQLDTPKRTRAPPVHLPKRIRAQQKNVRRYKVGFDVECNGRRLRKGHAFAVGINVSPAVGIDEGIVVVYSRRLSYQLLSADQLKELAAIYAEHAGNMEMRKALWSRAWIDNDWDVSCFEEFWGNNLDMLERLNANPSHATEAEYQAAFSETLAEIERIYQTDGSTLEYVFQNIGFDPTFCNDMLAAIGQRGLNYYRNNRHGLATTVVGPTVAGMLSGALRIPLDQLDWDLHVGPVMARLRAAASKEVVHDHDPVNDAKHILAQYLRAYDVVMEYVADLEAEAAAEIAADEAAKL